MLTEGSLLFALLASVYYTCNGVFISPIAYTLIDVKSVNGSSANGGCPQECEGIASGVRRCDCRSSSANITGALIDGMVPTINLSTRGTSAAELYTVETTRTTLLIGFLFQSSVMLHEVELYVFYCPAWDIGAATISVYNEVSFPNFGRIGASAESVGSMTLTSDMQNCEDLTRVSIPLQMATGTSSYFFEFTNYTQPEQFYIAEVRFSDQPIPLPTEPTITASPTADNMTMSTSMQINLPIISSIFSMTQSTIPSISTSSPHTTATPTTTTVPTAAPPTITTPTVPIAQPTTTPIVSPTKGTSSSFPVSAIAGGAVGGVLVLSLLVVIACAVILSYRKKEKRKKNHSRKDTQSKMKMKKNDAYLNMGSGPIHQQHSMATNETGEWEEHDDEAGYSEIKEENPDTDAEIQEENSDTEAAYFEVKEKSAALACFMGSNLNSTASAKSKNEEEKDKNNEEVEKQVLEHIYSVVRKTKKDKALKESGNDIPIPQDELEQLVYAPIYDVPALDMESLKLPKLTPENIKKVKTLGSGQFGKVILADTVDLSPKDLGLSDTDDDKSKSTRVAVKTLKKNPTASMKEAFEKELKFMSRLKHPNIIRTLGACMTVNTPFVVMEYMEKGDLNQYLLEFDGITQGNSPPKNLTISTGTLTNMSAQIASAMAYLVYRNFIHRDLATRNCLVGPDLEIKIADFGMSRNLYKSQYCLIQGHVVLPVRWMARECFSGKFSSKSDVWSFGVTMWEMFTLTKDIPYEDMDDQEIICDATKNGQSRKLLERPKDCPQKVYDIMLMCWAEDPHERATFEELYKVLSSVLT